MKCLACDEILTDQEATRKNSNNEFVDICFQCFPIEVNVKDEEDDLDKLIKEVLEEDEE